MKVNLSLPKLILSVLFAGGTLWLLLSQRVPVWIYVCFGYQLGAEPNTESAVQLLRIVCTFIAGSATATMAMVALQPLCALLFPRLYRGFRHILLIIAGVTAASMLLAYPVSFFTNPYVGSVLLESSLITAAFLLLFLAERFSKQLLDVFRCFQKAAT